MDSALIFLIALLASAIAGYLLGLFYFGGLWWTVKVLPSARAPGVLLIGSYLLRTFALLLGLYLVMGDQWPRLAACVVGLLVARFQMIRSIRIATEETGAEPSQLPPQPTKPSQM